MLAGRVLERPRVQADLGANCYIAKPGDLQAYCAVVRSLEEFWLGKVTLPRRDGHSLDVSVGRGL